MCMYPFFLKKKIIMPFQSGTVQSPSCWQADCSLNHFYFLLRYYILLHCFETLSIYCYYYLLRLEEAKILFSNFTWKKHFFAPEKNAPCLPPFSIRPWLYIRKAERKENRFHVKFNDTLATSSRKQFPYRYSK